MEDKDNEPIDYASLPPELVEKIKGWEKKKAENDPVARQLQLLTDIADISQELLGVSDKNKDTLAKSLPALGALLTDAREQLIKLNSETSKAMLAATDKLSKAITTSMKGLDVAPVFKPEFKPEFKPNIKVESPDVHVPAPQVTVDMKEIQKILKTDVPKAFKEAIALIPETVIPEAPDRWDEVLEWLQSIDTASRLKPVFPNQLTVVNPNGAAVGGLTPGSDYDYIDVQQTSSVVETYVFKTGGSGGTTVQTIVVTYTDSTKSDINYVSWA